jgi:Cu(I)/Ag(I) efflux system protein CusF
MNINKILASAAACALGAFVLTGALAQTPADHGTMDHSTMGKKPVTKAGVNPMTEGEVKKVNLQAQTITLTHGPIRNLEMPGMTMAFRVGDAALLKKVKAGDKVRFRAEQRDDVLFVTVIELAD